MQQRLMTNCALLETALGCIGLAWTEDGICRLVLPDPRPDGTLGRLRRAHPDAVSTQPPRSIATKLVRYAQGETVDFTEIPLDLRDTDTFRLALYRVARGIAYGRTMTYGELAAAAGFSGLFRETGEALGRNPVPILVPCHRIVAAGGKLGGFSAPGGAATKQRLLAMENAVPYAPSTGQKSFAF